MNNTYSFRNPILILLLLTLLQGLSFAGNYVATTSGKFSSTATWAGGIAPSATVSVDAITIMPGVTVDLDADLVLDGATAILDVQGSLMTTTANKLIINEGTFTGTGTVDVKSVELHGGSNFLFTGTMTTDKATVTSTLSTTADVIVRDSLKMVNGSLTFMTLGSLEMKENTTIVMEDGWMTTAGGSVSFTGNYDVHYLNSATTSGVELTGSTLTNVKLDLDENEKLVLTTDVTMGGTLDLSSGGLDLGGKDLTVNGDVKSSTGYVFSTSPSSITLNTTYGTTGALKFDATGATVQDFTVNAGTGAEVKVSGDLTVDGTLDITDGKFSFTDGSLTLNGTMSGNGKFTGGSTSSLVINTSSGLSTSLDFSTGIQTLKDLTINTGTTGSVTLASDLEVQGKLDLMNYSTLNIGDNQLTIGTNATIAGTGEFSTTPQSSIKILTQAQLDSLRLSGSIGTFSMQTTTGTIIMGGHLVVMDSLELNGGKLDLNGYDLTVSGIFSTSPETRIASTSSTDIVINTTVAPEGAIVFDETYNQVGTFTVNVNDSSYVKIGADMEVTNELQLSKGSLDIGANALIISSTAAVVDASTEKYVIMDANGYMEMSLTAGAGQATLYPIGTTDYYSPASISLTGTASGKVQVNVSKDVYDQGTTGNDLTTTSSAVDLTWHINSDITSDLNMDLTLMWDADSEVNTFDKTQAYISHYTEGSWDVSAMAEATHETNGMFSLTRTGITSLSPFAVFDVNTVTGVEETFGDALTVYPNPVTDHLSIRYDEFAAEPLSFELYNATGQLISSNRISEANTEIRVDDLQEGNYFIRFSGNNKNATHQFVKM